MVSVIPSVPSTKPSSDGVIVTVTLDTPAPTVSTPVEVDVLAEPVE